MDPITVLQNRIEQLEAKLGVAANAPVEPQQAAPQGQQMQYGDTMTANLLQAAAAMNNVTPGHEKLQEAMHMASELNNYTDPQFAEKIQQKEMKMREVAAAEPAIRHHCHCMHQCRQQAPVMESEPILEVPRMQPAVDNLGAAAAQVKAEADMVSQGVVEAAATVGQAASNASEQLAAVAQKVEQVEEKKYTKRRNGLD